LASGSELADFGPKRLKVGVLEGHLLDLRFAADGHRAIIVSCLDNLLKGASGQAVQNLNVMFGWPEAEGLE